MRNKCAHRRRPITVQESTAVDGGINDTGEHTGCIVSLRVLSGLCLWLLEL